MNRKEAQHVHARRRCLQRFGIHLGPQQHAALVRQIQGHTATFLKQQSRRVSLWLVTLMDGAQAKVAYDKKTKQIATLIPVDEETCFPATTE